MKRSRWRRWVVGALALASSVLLCLAVVSHWIAAGYVGVGATWEVNLARGGLVYRSPSPSGAAPGWGWEFIGPYTRDNAPGRWWFVMDAWTYYTPYSTTSKDTILVLPLWAIALLFAAAAALTWWPVRWPRRRGCCWRCGYSRAGLAAGTRCPECGAEPGPRAKA